MRDSLDRAIINKLQGGFPVSERPFADAAREIGTTEEELIRRIGRLLDDGVLSRFGPMYRAERMGGAVTLAAMRVPRDELERVAERVNAFAEVAHNYEREHSFNLWFVVAADAPERVDEVITAIERETGYPVYRFPKLEEFYIGLRLDV